MNLVIDYLLTCCMGDTSISTGRVGVDTESKSKLVTSRSRGDPDRVRDWDKKSLLGEPRKECRLGPLSLLGTSVSLILGMNIKVKIRKVIMIAKAYLLSNLFLGVTEGDPPTDFLPFAVTGVPRLFLDFSPATDCLLLELLPAKRTNFWKCV